MKFKNLNFASNYIKIKSCWFDQESKIKKIEPDGYFLYLILYKFYIPNQEVDTFSVSIKHLSKESGFSKERTLELIKKLIRIKIIQASVTRWDRVEDETHFFLYAIDTPQTHRDDKGGKEVDVPNTESDHYIIIDMRLMQLYMDSKINNCAFSFYAIMNKFHNLENKNDMTVVHIAQRLGISNDKVHKCIYDMNRQRFMYSAYRNNGMKMKSGRKRMTYRFEHHIFSRINTLEEMRQMYQDNLKRNVERWDKKKDKIKNKEGDSGNIKNDFENEFEDEDEDFFK